MSTTQSFWLMMLAVLALVIGSSFGEFAGSSAKSLWLAALVGFAVAIAIAFIMQPFRRGDEHEEFLERFIAKIGIPPLVFALVFAIAVFGAVLYLVASSTPNEIGMINYSKPVTGGFWIGIAVVALISGIRQRKLDLE